MRSHSVVKAKVCCLLMRQVLDEQKSMYKYLLWLTASLACFYREERVSLSKEELILRYEGLSVNF